MRNIGLSDPNAADAILWRLIRDCITDGSAVQDYHAGFAVRADTASLLKCHEYRWFQENVGNSENR